MWHQWTFNLWQSTAIEPLTPQTLSLLKGCSDASLRYNGCRPSKEACPPSEKLQLTCRISTNKGCPQPKSTCPQTSVSSNLSNPATAITRKRMTQCIIPSSSHHSSHWTTVTHHHPQTHVSVAKELSHKTTCYIWWNHQDISPPSCHNKPQGAECRYPLQFLCNLAYAIINNETGGGRQEAHTAGKSFTSVVKWFCLALFIVDVINHRNAPVPSILTPPSSTVAQCSRPFDWHLRQRWWRWIMSRWCGQFRCFNFTK